MKIYTKTGDKGESSLFSGERVKKNHHRLECYGSIDELNVALGFLLTALDSAKKSEGERQLLDKIQSNLFKLGSFLATTPANWSSLKLSFLMKEDVEELEKAMDEWDKELPPLKNFILPGSSTPANDAHWARVITRKVERQMVALQGEEADSLPPLALHYINRLSDLFFVLARFLDKKQGISERVWVP